MKLLKEQGFDVEIVVPKDDREYVDLNSAEIWLPLLVFAAQPVWDLTVRSLVGAIKSFFAQRKVDATEDVELPPALLHLKCSFEQADGSRRAFEAHGSPSDVVKSLRAFGNVE